MKEHGVKFQDGIPGFELLPKWFPEGGLLVFDDPMKEGGNDKRVLDMFTKHSHHHNITVMYLCQDIFPPGKYCKSISRNAHYIVAFKNPRDQLGMRNLLLQAFPTRWQDVHDTFRRVTERPFAYMLLDFHSKSDDNLRIITHLLKEEGCMRCYQFPLEDKMFTLITSKLFYRRIGATMSTPVSLLNGSQTKLVNSDLLHRWMDCLPFTTVSGGLIARCSTISNGSTVSLTDWLYWSWLRG